MKAQIIGLATLEITPENSTENYALRKWRDDFSRNREGNPNEACLQIKTINDGWESVK